MPPSPRTILLVEDQSDLKVFLSNLLASDGYRTIYAGGETDGLKKTRIENPDLIIIDMMMPADQGIRLYRALKKTADLKTLPVIMLSSIERRMFYQCHKIHQPKTASGLPVPEAYIETPPEADELLRLVGALVAPGKK